jgi:glycosyltransferase involved in cell wall biosynthesis
MKPKKVAIVAEWMTSRGGAEKVFETFCEMYPEADIFTTVYNRSLFPRLKNRTVKTSFLQKIPYFNRKHQYLLPLLPRAMEGLNLGGYDLIISSSSAFGKGFKKPKDAIHVCYCHTPMRYVWQTDIDRRLINLPLGNLIINWLKEWDLKTNRGVDYFVSNSNYTKERVEKYYKRDAKVIYPPVYLERSREVSANKQHKRKDFYFAISRLIPYKRFDLAIRACNELGKSLIIAGAGPELEKLRKISGPTISYLGNIDEKDKNKIFREAKALIFPAEEDFGIVPVEAMSQGCPVIASKRGGTSETITDGKTGVLFDEQSVDGIKKAILRLEKSKFNERGIISQAKKFSKERFIKDFSEFVRKI